MPFGCKFFVFRKPLVVKSISNRLLLTHRIQPQLQQYRVYICLLSTPITNSINDTRVPEKCVCKQIKRNTHTHKIVQIVKPSKHFNVHSLYPVFVTPNCMSNTYALLSYAETLNLCSNNLFIIHLFIEIDFFEILL